MSDFDRKEMGVRLAKLRIEKQLSQEQVAEAIGVGRATYNTVEAGTRPLKDYELSTLSRLFETSIDYILHGTQSDNIGLADATGLSDSAILYLQTVNKNRSIPNEPFDMFPIPDWIKNVRIHQLFNLILSSDGDSFLAHTADYIFSDFSNAMPLRNNALMWERIDGLAFGDGGNNIYSFVTVPVESMRFAMLREIEADIEELRKKTHKSSGNESKKRIRRAKK